MKSFIHPEEQRAVLHLLLLLLPLVFSRTSMIKTERSLVGRVNNTPGALSSRSAANQTTRSARSVGRVTSRAIAEAGIVTSRAMAEAGITTLNEDRMKNNAMALREYRSEVRAPPTPLPIPERIGSIASGGVSGFGFQHGKVRVPPEKYATAAGYPALIKPEKENGQHESAITPGPVPWWQRSRFNSGRGGPG